MTEMDKRLVPEVNIGTLGHVDHGKSTLVETVSGHWPALHSEELKRGITIKIGYADATIYRCEKCGIFCSKENCPRCFEKCEPKRTVSFVDAPGHEALTATVLAGTALMDGVLFVIAANEPCPQAQTKEHLTALNIAGIKNIVIVQTKIDLVSLEQAKENYKQIKDFVKETVAENAPVIPVSAQQKINMDALLEAIEENIKTPERDLSKDPKMIVARSFDINKPGAPVEKLFGGVLGGSIIEGRLKLGDEIEIRPGIKRGNKYESLFSKIVGLQKAGKNLEEATAGGLVGLMTGLDNSLTKADSLAGSVIGLMGKLPETRDKLSLQIHLLEKISLKTGDMLMITVKTARTVGVIKNLKGNNIEVELKLPLCCSKNDRAAISKKTAEKWRLIGYGEVV